MALSIAHNVNEVARDRELAKKREAFMIREHLKEKMLKHGKEFQTKKAGATTPTK